MSRIYVGIKPDGSREVFSRMRDPKPGETPQFTSVLGPFRTRAGAALAVSRGVAPHVSTVEEYERIARSRGDTHPFLRPMGAGSEVRARSGQAHRENGATMRSSLGDWITALSFYQRHRRGDEAKLGHNTVLRTRSTGVPGSEDVEVVLHRTPIVTYHADGTLTLNSGGYRTVTTKARMNEVLPQFIGVVQKKGEWIVLDARDGSTLPFTDGMRIRVA